MTETQAPDGFTLIELTREPIELYKILKFESLVSSGGEAKLAIESGLVRVNGAVETQKRKKIHSGDTVEFQDSRLFMGNAPMTTNQAQTPHPAISTRPKKTSRGAIPALSSGGTVK